MWSVNSGCAASLGESNHVARFSDIWSADWLRIWYRVERWCGAGIHRREAGAAGVENLAIRRGERLQPATGAAQFHRPGRFVEHDVDRVIAAAAPAMPGHHQCVEWVRHALVAPAPVDVASAPRVRAEAVFLRGVLGGKDGGQPPIVEVGVALFRPIFRAGSGADRAVGGVVGGDRPEPGSGPSGNPGGNVVRHRRS